MSKLSVLPGKSQSQEAEDIVDKEKWPVPAKGAKGAKGAKEQWRKAM